MKFATKPSRRETILGGIYLILYVFVLPMAVPMAVVRLLPWVNAAQSNAIFFAINFAATLLIFRDYLIRTCQDALRVPGKTLWAALLGYLGSMMLSTLVSLAILRLYPEFTNVNDSAITAMSRQSRTLMAIGGVFLAPVTEELLFRGLIFRNLYSKSRFFAYALSMVLFSLIHVSGYIGLYEWKLLALCFVQYLAPALCLNLAYRYSGTLVAPILLHMLNNLAAFSAMR